MKKNLKNILFIVLLIFAFSSKVFAADYVEELVTDPSQSSLIQNTPAEKKFQRIKTKKKKKNPKKAEIQKENSENSEVVLDADYMDYYPDRYEMEAVGNAKLTLKKENLTITANKIIFNHDLNTVKAFDNVKIINESSETEGDFLHLDLNQENGWMTRPITHNYDVRITSEQGYIYPDRIEEYDGVAKILKNYDMRFGASSFASLVNPGGVGATPFATKKKYDENIKDRGAYRIKAKVIYVDSRDEHNVMTLKNADIYMKKIKVGSLPSLKVVSNKEHQYVETNIPEFGQVSQLGMYAGPSIVLNTPGSSTLKLTPILNYADSKFGLGGIARFRNSKNLTEIAYGSAKDEFVIRGSHKLTEKLRMDYSQNAYQDEWFLGYRRPRYSAQLQYDTNDYIDDLNLTFSQRFSGGFFVDDEKQFKDPEGRFRWMTQTQKTLYSYTNQNRDFNLQLGAVAQTSLSLYTTGDTVGIVRLGPMFRTAYKNWTQDLIYYQTATAGQSAFVFDKYAYGKSNVVLIESLKINKYLSFGYLASLALLRDNNDDNIFQENRFLVSLGPDYAKVTFGYDAFRQSTMMLFSMLVGTEGSEVKFDKAVIKNPDTLTKVPKKRFDLSKVFPNLKKKKSAN